MPNTRKPGRVKGVREKIPESEWHFDRGSVGPDEIRKCHAYEFTREAFRQTKTLQAILGKFAIAESTKGAGGFRRYRDLLQKCEQVVGASITATVHSEILSVPWTEFRKCLVEFEDSELPSSCRGKRTNEKKGAQVKENLVFRTLWSGDGTINRIGNFDSDFLVPDLAAAEVLEIETNDYLAGWFRIDLGSPLTRLKNEFAEIIDAFAQDFPPANRRDGRKRPRGFYSELRELGVMRLAEHFGTSGQCLEYLGQFDEFEKWTEPEVSKAKKKARETLNRLFPKLET